MTTSLRLLTVLGLAAGALAAPASASAQARSLEEAAAAARHRTLAGRIPFAGLTQSQTRRDAWTVNSFYVVDEPASNVGASGGRRALHYVVLGEAGGSAGASRRWAESHTCPAILDMLLAMERLPAVRPDAPGLGREPEFSLTLDGVVHTFWTAMAQSGPRDATVGLEITGNVNSPVALWWKAAEDGLTACWSATPPAGLAVSD
jgi:hypothetical protein